MLLRRGLLLWLLARAMLLVVGVAANRTGMLLSVSPRATLMLLCAVGALGVLESQRVNEHRFLANLGVSPIVTALLVLLPALVGELVLGMLLRR